MECEDKECIKEVKNKREQMRVLVACEESQRVCIEFRKRGHLAFSCDILDCSGDHPEWHIKGDVLKLLDGDCRFKTCDGRRYHLSGKWDMIIAFPPCTHLAVSGARHFEKKRADGRQREGIEFFCKILNADCDKVVVENPVNIISGDYVKKWFPDLCKKYKLPIKPTQMIQPWMFGENATKKTCLWIKGVKPLRADVKNKPEIEYVEYGNRRRMSKWMYDTRHKTFNGNREGAILASKTFLGVAKAMAEQWG